MLAQLEHRQSLEFLIIKDDSLLYEQYWENYKPNSASNSFSMAKSITSILIGIAVDEGKIKSIDEPVGNYLEHFKSVKNEKLTIRHLLMMCSGLSWDESYSSLFSITTEAYYGNDLEALVKTLHVVEEPGKTFEYMSGNTLLLGMIVEKATEMKLSDYAGEKLWKPLGASLQAQWSLDHADGTEKAYCCFYSNARDFARLGQLFLNKGKWNDKQIVSESWVEQSIAPIMVKDKSGKVCDWYGFQWWLMKRKGRNVFYARGLYGQYILVVPDERLVIVRLGKSQGDKVNGKYHDMIDYTDGVLDMLAQKH
jgi:CubicO group peptidase (beta-lactamase class C family)